MTSLRQYDIEILYYVLPVRFYVFMFNCLKSGHIYTDTCNILYIVDGLI